MEKYQMGPIFLTLGFMEPKQLMNLGLERAMLNARVEEIDVKSREIDWTPSKVNIFSFLNRKLPFCAL